MDNKVNLIDLNFKNFPSNEKRAALVAMDVMLKKLHENGLMVTDFNPNNIYFQDGIYFFEKTLPISSVVADNKDEAILNNVIWMSVLALWTYNTSPSLNLTNPLFVHNHFDSFSYWYPEEDRAYYQSILIDSYREGKFVSPTIYFSDYVIQQHKNNAAGNHNNLAYIKATEIGKALADQDEAAFGHNFFFITVVASLTVILVGIIFYLSIYFG